MIPEEKMAVDLVLKIANRSCTIYFLEGSFEGYQESLVHIFLQFACVLREFYLSLQMWFMVENALFPL